MQTIDETVFKAYDVRGLYPSQINEDLARHIGRAFVAFLDAKRIAVSRDMRVSSPTLSAAFIDGARTQGADVVDFGMLATDMLYYAVARDHFDGGAQITASHNPKEYNGVKMVRQQAFPLSGDAGISDIREMILADQIPTPTAYGNLREQQVLDDYLEHILSFVDLGTLRPFRLVLDAGSGMGGLVAPALFDRLPFQTTTLCFDIDGTFPQHEANPLIARNRRDLVQQVKEDDADVGIAWDGDADRCFFVDGDGEFVSGDFITALLAEAFLRKEAGANIVYDVRASHAVKDTVTAFGGSPLMNRVGHAFFKRRMREEDAAFGGEVTGHYYFRNNFFADNGFIPALLVLELMSVKNMTLKQLLAPLRQKYFISGEINTEMPDMNAVKSTIERIKNAYQDGKTYEMDGVSVEYSTWHFNVRPSNTEPLIRLNLESNSQISMETRRDEVLALIRA